MGRDNMQQMFDYTSTYFTTTTKPPTVYVTTTTEVPLVYESDESLYGTPQEPAPVPPPVNPNLDYQERFDGIKALNAINKQNGEQVLPQLCAKSSPLIPNFGITAQNAKAQMNEIYD